MLLEFGIATQCIRTYVSIPSTDLNKRGVLCSEKGGGGVDFLYICVLRFVSPEVSPPSMRLSRALFSA